MTWTCNTTSTGIWFNVNFHWNDRKWWSECRVQFEYPLFTISSSSYHYARSGIKLKINPVMQHQHRQPGTVVRTCESRVASSRSSVYSGVARIYDNFSMYISQSIVVNILFELHYNKTHLVFRLRAVWTVALHLDNLVFADSYTLLWIGSCRRAQAAPCPAELPMIHTYALSGHLYQIPIGSLWLTSVHTDALTSPQHMICWRSGELQPWVRSPKRKLVNPPLWTLWHAGFGALLERTTAPGQFEYLI